MNEAQQRAETGDTANDLLFTPSFDGTDSWIQFGEDGEIDRGLTQKAIDDLKIATNTQVVAIPEPLI